MVITPPPLIILSMNDDIKAALILVFMVLVCLHVKHDEEQAERLKRLDSFFWDYKTQMDNFKTQQNKVDSMLRYLNDDE